jgi:hypothetical protein
MDMKNEYRTALIDPFKQLRKDSWLVLGVYFFGGLGVLVFSGLRGKCVVNCGLDVVKCVVKVVRRMASERRWLIPLAVTGFQRVKWGSR